MAAPSEPALPVDSCGALLTNALMDAGIIGIDETPEQPMINRAFTQTNWLLAQWARKRWLVYRIQDYSFVCTGAQTYSVGLKQTVDINPRPDRLEYAFLRFLNQSGGGGNSGGSPVTATANFLGFIVANMLFVVQVTSGTIAIGSTVFGALPGTTITGFIAGTLGGAGEYTVSQSQTVGGPGLSASFTSNSGGPSPTQTSSQFLVDIPIDIIQSHEDYARIPVKGIGTLAWKIFYDPIWPVGLLFPWPIPQANIYEIHVGFKVVLPRFASIQQPINFPPEYEAALNWNLARRFRATYQMPPDPEINSLAKDSLNVLRLANSAIGVLRMPMALRGRNRAYDYRGDSA